ncbi:HEAT repeat domain-containing protein [Flavilitoribacter nigricans]|uniref:HEAT repeat domain-containing protein n=1 Tax=Flavilitoribacter nigricans (strain ATCC 23147 / DSM 23189 / NBRC 102662 / NCIMB 1420 / SS-2) TaxID=1122177 RepID=A0A2D0N2L3_FLAN2|nr:hypothetical protein [Flavilitoribacter nigricans]PHN02626.1 hypothetical protein CRP01_31015 [Flavilitoribacter nigricans DSM 23189 = NBRC 102662]
MENQIPENLITQARLQRKVAGYSLYFDLTCTAYGELVDLQADILRWPEGARRLTFGDDWETIERELRRSEPYFRLGVALAGQGVLTIGEWETLTANIQTLRELPEFRDRPGTGWIADPWLHWVWHDTPEGTSALDLEMVADLFLNKHRSRVLREMPDQPAAFMEPVLLNLLEWIPEYHFREVYVALGRLNTENGQQVLLRVLEDRSLEEQHEGAICGLCLHPSPQVREGLRVYYRRHPKMPDNSKVHIFSTLASDRDPALKKWALREFPHEYIRLSEVLLDILRSAEMPETEIAGILLKKIRGRAPIKVIYSALQHFVAMEATDLLPPVEDLKKLIEWAAAQDEGYTLRPSIAALLQRRPAPEMGDFLQGMTRQENEKVVAAGLYYLGMLGAPAHIKAVFAKVHDERYSVASQALTACKQLLEKYHDPELLAFFVAGINNEDKMEKLKFLQLVTPQMWSDGTDDFLNILIGQLNHSSPSVRIAALEALRRFGLDPASPCLSDIREDRHPSVRKRVNQLFFPEN